MKKSIKNFLIISQVLGWSALMTSACTDDQVNTATQNTINSNKSNDSGTTKTDQNGANDKNKINSEVSNDSIGESSDSNTSKDAQANQGKKLKKSDSKGKVNNTHEMDGVKNGEQEIGDAQPKAKENDKETHPKVDDSKESEQVPGKENMVEGSNPEEHPDTNGEQSIPKAERNMLSKGGDASTAGHEQGTPETANGQGNSHTSEPSSGGGAGEPGTSVTPNNPSQGGETSNSSS